MKRAVAMVCMALSSAALSSVVVDASEPNPAELTVMQQKLVLTQNLLEAVATEDFDAARTNSEQLSQLTRDAAWLADRSPAFRRQSAEFERAAHLLGELAKKKHTSGTTLGFLHVTLSCIQCHRYLRDESGLELGELKLPPVSKEPEGEAAKSFWMTKKLELSRNILAALAVGQPAAIVDDAEQISALSKLEGWARRKDVNQYRNYLTEFRRANDDLIAQARDGDLDNAALAYTQLTLSCVKCHEHLRRQK